MCSTKTTDINATTDLISALANAGAGLVRLAVDNLNDVEALIEIRKKVPVNLSVDLQENYRLVEQVAPWVDKIRYNPGHLHHFEPEISWQKKVEFIANTARKFDCALRIGVNCGSIDPQQNNCSVSDPAFASAVEHADFLQSIGFDRFCVSLKDSDPEKVIDLNRKFSKLRPRVPLHLGVTEAGLPPFGILKSRMAMEPLLAQGIGDTLRVSLTVVNEKKSEEVRAGFKILENVKNGTILDPQNVALPRLNIISCPSCSRSNNHSFVELAERIRNAVDFAQDLPLTIAVMGCRVNGPGETDDADIGLWCGADHVNLKKGKEKIGSFSFDAAVQKVIEMVREDLNSFNKNN